jgi:hypothetical protein
MVHILQWLIVFVIGVLILPRRTGNYEYLLLFSLISIFALSPFNHSTWGGELRGHLNYNTFYNRFGDVLFILSICLFLPHRARPRPGQDAAVIAGILSLAFMTKITLFMLLYVVAVVYLFLRHREVGSLKAASALLFPWLVMVLVHLSFPGYLASIGEVGKVRSLYSLDNTVFRISPLVKMHMVEFLAAAAGCLMLFVLVRLNDSLSWSARVNAGAVYTISLGGSLALTLTNYGDLGMLPLAMGFYVVSRWLPPSSVPENGRPVFTPPFGRRTMLAMALLIVAVYAGAQVISTLRFSERNGWGQAPGLGVDNPYISQRFRTNRWPVKHRSDLELIVNSRSQFNSGPRDFVFWITEASRAADVLAERQLPADTRVYAVTFPTYIFSLLADFRVPAGTRPWLLVGHNVGYGGEGLDVPHLLRQVDVVMVDNCCLQKDNREKLWQFFREPLKAEFSEEQITGCWDMWQRR